MIIKTQKDIYMAIGKLKHILLGVGTLAAAVSLNSCKSFQGAEVNVKPNPLEVHADSIKFTVKATIPPKSGFKKKGTYLGKLVIKGGEGEYQVGSLTITSAQFPNIKKEGASITYNGAAKFEEGMDGGNLTAVNTYERKKKRIDLPDIKLAPCCITTSRLVADENYVLFTEVDYQPRTPITLEAKFQFPQNVYDIQPTELEKAEIKAIGDFLNKKYQAKKVIIEGYASPEGTYKRNEFLSVNRAKQVQNWLIDQLKQHGYNVYLDSTFFEFRTTTEDWDGFLKNLNQLNLPENKKQQIIQIVSAGYKPEVTERKVMALVGGAEKVEFILSPLRRATIRLEGYTSAYSDEQIDSLVKEFAAGKISDEKIAELLDDEALRYAMKKAEDLDTKIGLMKAYVRKHPKDYRGYNDLGALLVKKGMTDEAIDVLTQANNLKPNNYAVLNNLGVAQKAKGNFSEAFINLQSSYSAKATPEAAFALGVLYEKTAQYNEAAEQFGNASSLPRAKYNQGLSKLLMGDLAGAKMSLEDEVRSDKKYALGYYVLAIVGARSGDANLLALNLRKAVENDKSLAKKASKDLEFRKYWNAPQFQSAIK